MVASTASSDIKIDRLSYRVIGAADGAVVPDRTLRGRDLTRRHTMTMTVIAARSTRRLARLMADWPRSAGGSAPCPPRARRRSDQRSDKDNQA
jgi:hypothetical protein